METAGTCGACGHARSRHEKREMGGCRRLLGSLVERGEEERKREERFEKKGSDVTVYR